MVELLLELLSEEIPARMQDRAAEDLKRLVCDKLTEAGLGFDRAEAFATPRRLALVVDGLPTDQPEVKTEKRGPKRDAPDQALAGFARSIGASKDFVPLFRKLEPDGEPLQFLVPTDIEPGEVVEVSATITAKGTQLCAKQTSMGRPTAQMLPRLINAAIKALAWPKSMRWGSSEFGWVRPLHNVLALFNGDILYGGLEFGTRTVPDELPELSDFEIPVNLLEFTGTTLGHRFMAQSPIMDVTCFADYRNKLRAAYVMLDAAERRGVIEQDARLAAEAEGLTVKPDPALVAENAGLVEWPVVLMGAIDPAYMYLPSEVLTTAMRHHLKHFALLDGEGKLAPRFLVVANMDAVDGGKQIVAGNERVLRARLSDAKFFWDQDRKRSLESRVPDLDKVVFHARLGSVGEKALRIERLAPYIAEFMVVDGNRFSPEEAKETLARTRAAGKLCKADLVTGMVQEFPELQGSIGRYYALEEGKDAAVADAIAEHYSPRGPNDDCPSVAASVAVALADKIDSLVGFWAIDEKPTGSKDPFALRRAALGVIRLVIENKLRVSLYECFAKANELYPREIRASDSVPSPHIDVGLISSSLLVFVIDRLKVHLREKGILHDLINAVFAVPRHGGGLEDDLVRLLNKVDAVREFLAGEDGTNLLTAYKRAGKILSIEETRDSHRFDGGVDSDLLSRKEEIALHKLVSDAEFSAYAAVDREDFRSAMVALSMLRTPVDSFFDNVTVNVENDKERRENRLALLQSIMVVMNQVADFSQIEGGER